MQGKLLWKRKAYIPPLLWVAASSGTLCPSPQLPTATEDCPVYIHGSSVGSRGNGVTAWMRDSCFVPYICQTSSYLHAVPSLTQWCPSKGSPENLGVIAFDGNLMFQTTFCPWVADSGSHSLLFLGGPGGTQTHYSLTSTTSITCSYLVSLSQSLLWGGLSLGLHSHWHLDFVVACPSS